MKVTERREKEPRGPLISLRSSEEPRGSAPSGPAPARFLNFLSFFLSFLSGWPGCSSGVHRLQKTLRIRVWPLFVHDFLSVCARAAYCSSKSCNDRFFFLFYAELGSVIRAPFLTDRSILITKSSACSKGSARTMAPRAAGPAARATPAGRRGTKPTVDEAAGARLQPESCPEWASEAPSKYSEFLQRYFVESHRFLCVGTTTADTCVVGNCKNWNVEMP